MKFVDLGFDVCFDVVGFPVNSIDTWVHEFSEMSIADLLEEDYGILVFVDDPSGESVITWFRIAHIMVSLHTSSSFLYLDGSEKLFTPDEFAFQILDCKGLPER